MFRKTAFFSFSIFFLFSISSVFAVLGQEESVSVSVSEVSNLTKVEGNLNFQQLIPGYEYASNLSVLWNVPQQALFNIASKEVLLYVKIIPQNANRSWLYFRNGSSVTKELNFVLKCKVDDSACVSSSLLSVSFPAFVTAPLQAIYPHNEGLIVNASFLPFAEGRSVRIIELERFLDEIAALISGQKSAGREVSDAEQALSSSVSSKNAGDYDDALRFAELSRKLAESSPLKSGAESAGATSSLSASPTSLPNPLSGFAVLSRQSYVLGFLTIAILVLAFFYYKKE